MALLAFADCGPVCPRAGTQRADLPPDRAFNERRIVLDTNVIAQVNRSPAVMFLRVAGVESVARRFSIRSAAGEQIAQLDGSPGSDGRYRIALTPPNAAPLRAGIYRLHVEVPEPLEASFEVRSCTVYY
jgi:hypothetical protein